ncbi:hypothetical protein Rhopal_005421-T1 [Rhodotorula paludigena]|uniref:WW domain-containing protein n=1 Tax=Rhodotorula paludigena TaxID=86838 RepID=A0AAV5GIH3_9BASI|nr:hypothetical protein Rhopal_005421-T1 [Rhodotorula paludigena]
MSGIPNEAPPAYTAQDPSRLDPSSAGAASTSTSNHRRTPSAGSTRSSNYTTDEDRADEAVIPGEARRTMLDEARPLPDGWRREFDPNSQHYFYVDTKANPPRSIWSHPLDPEFLESHPEIAKELAAAAEKESGESGAAGATPTPSDEKEGGKLSRFFSRSDDKKDGGAQHASGSGAEQGKKEEKRSLGRKMKDKLTNSTHEERVEQRRQRAIEEKKQYEEYLRRRQEILGAVQSGRYQPAYAAPAGPYTMRPMYGGMYGPGYGYRRPYGYGMYPAGPLGYGSGIGMGRGPGAGLAVGGGLLGGMALGSLLF